MIKAILILSFFTVITFSQVEVKTSGDRVNFTLNLTQYTDDITFKIYQNNECVFGVTFSAGDIETFEKRLPKGDYYFELTSYGNLIKKDYIKVR